MAGSKAGTFQRAKRTMDPKLAAIRSSLNGVNLVIKNSEHSVNTHFVWAWMAATCVLSFTICTLFACAVIVANEL